MRILTDATTSDQPLFQFWRMQLLLTNFFLYFDGCNYFFWPTPFSILTDAASADEGGVAGTLLRSWLGTFCMQVCFLFFWTMKSTAFGFCFSTFNKLIMMQIIMVLMRKMIVMLPRVCGESMSANELFYQTEVWVNQSLSSVAAW